MHCVSNNDIHKNRDNCVCMYVWLVSMFTNFFTTVLDRDFFFFFTHGKRITSAFETCMHLSIINGRRKNVHDRCGSGHRSKRSSSSSNWPHSILEWRTSGLVHGWTSTFHCDRAICELSPLGHRNCSLALLTVTTDSQFVRNGDSLLDAV